MAGYTRVFAKIPGDRIDAEDFNDEYDSVEAAFSASTGHSHDGTASNGALVPRIASPDNFNFVFANGNLNEIQFAVDVAGAAETQLYLRDGILVPAVNNTVDLGTSTERFRDLHVETATINQLSLPGGYPITAILDDGTLGDDSDSILATQRSIKEYVDAAVGSAGVIRQVLFQQMGASQNLSGAFADYLSITDIEVEESSRLHIFATVTASADVTAGTVFARLYLDGNILNPATSDESYVVSTLTAPSSAIYQTISLNDSTPQLDGESTHEVSIRLREQGTTGIAWFATLIVFEERYIDPGDGGGPLLPPGEEPGY
jgi:hypothetical protein